MQFSPRSAWQIPFPQSAKIKSIKSVLNEFSVFLPVHPLGTLPNPEYPEGHEPQVKLPVLVELQETCKSQPP